MTGLPLKAAAFFLARFRQNKVIVWIGIGDVKSLYANSSMCCRVEMKLKKHTGIAGSAISNLKDGRWVGVMAEASTLSGCFDEF
jgi:hypothetical protein